MYVHSIYIYIYIISLTLVQCNVKLLHEQEISLKTCTPIDKVCAFTQLLIVRIENRSTERCVL